MKKLMIAALAVAMGGVVFAGNDCGDPLACPFVYRVKLAGKTVSALATESNKVTCAEGKCWAKPASLRIAGYFYGVGAVGTGSCGDTCECKDADKYVENTVFWDANKKEVKFTKVEIPLFEVLRNGGAQNKAQILMQFDDLNLAGFAAFNPVTKNIKSANGFFAGKLPAAQCVTAGKCSDPDETSAALVFDPCDLDPATIPESAGSIAFGRWNLAYKADKVALANKLATKQGYTAETVWAVPGLVTPTGFVPAN